jgi:hypothetical protein
MHLNNGRSAWKDAYMSKGTATRVRVARRAKLNFDQIAALVLKIMDIKRMY